MTQPDDRGAIAARREQVAGFDRPERLSDLSIKDAVADIRDTDDLFKVYVPEWIIKFTSLKTGHEGRAEAVAYFDAKFDERVRPEDVRFLASSTVMPDEFPTFLQLRLPNIKGEFKTKALAEAHVKDRGYAGAVIVSRNSREDYQLREYGTKKLTKAQLASA